MKKAFFAAFLAILTLTIDARASVLTARFTFDDGSPVAGKVMIFRAATPDDVVVGSYTLDAQGRVSSDITLNPADSYRAQLISPTGNVIQQLWTIMPSSAIVSATIEALSAGEVDIVLAKTDKSVKNVVFVPFGTTLDFEAPAPAGTAGSQIVGVYKDIDWGPGAWCWEEAFGPDSNNNIYFNSSSGTSRSFSFAQPRVLQSMRVFSTVNGTLTLSSDQGEVKTQNISADQMVALSTGWNKPATTITVTFTGGWELGIDQIVYQ